MSAATNTTTTSNILARSILPEGKQESTTALLQQNLVDLVDLSLLLKQAHWNVLGKNFRSIHLQLDEIIGDARSSGDEVAERIVALGAPADGRASTVSSDSSIDTYPSDFQSVASTVANVADALAKTVDGLRASIRKLGDLDPISEDLCIGISGTLEKHLWMVQAQEVELD